MIEAMHELTATPNLRVSIRVGKNGLVSLVTSGSSQYGEIFIHPGREALITFSAVTQIPTPIREIITIDDLVARDPE